MDSRPPPNGSLRVWPAPTFAPRAHCECGRSKQKQSICTYEQQRNLRPRKQILLASERKKEKEKRKEKPFWPHLGARPRPRLDLLHRAAHAVLHPARTCRSPESRGTVPALAWATLAGGAPWPAARSYCLPTAAECRLPCSAGNPCSMQSHQALFREKRGKTRAPKAGVRRGQGRQARATGQARQGRLYATHLDDIGSPQPV